MTALLQTIDGWDIYNSSHSLLARSQKHVSACVFVDHLGLVNIQGTRKVPHTVLFRILDHYEASCHRAR